MSVRGERRRLRAEAAPDGLDAIAAQAEAFWEARRAENEAFWAEALANHSEDGED